MKYIKLFEKFKWETTGDKDDKEFLTGLVNRTKSVYGQIKPAKYNLDDFDEDLDKLLKKFVKDSDSYFKAKDDNDYGTSNKIHGEWMKAAQKQFKHVTTNTAWRGYLNTFTRNLSTIWQVHMEAEAGRTGNRGYKVYKRQNFQKSLQQLERVKLFETFIGEGVTFGKKGIKSKLEDKLEIAQQAIDKWGDSYQGVYDRVAKAAKTGKIDVNNIFYVQGAEPQNNYEIFNGSSAAQLASEIHKVLKKYKKYEVEGSSIPAMAGWSGTMRSTVGGGIDGRVNFSNGKNTYLIAVTVGGGVDRSIREKIFQEVYELMFVFDEYNSTDGGVSIDMDNGTNYHTLGIKRRGESFVRSFADRLQQTIDLG